MGGDTNCHPCCSDISVNEINICCASAIDKISIKMRSPDDNSVVIHRSNTEVESWGGRGGRAWSFLPREGGITKIIVRSGSAVDSLSFVGSDRTGNTIASPQFGSKRGGRPHESNTEIQAWGGPGGGGWSFLPQGNGGITKIIIRSGDAIDSISFVGEEGNGHQSFSRNFGGNGGRAQEINLEWPREYLTSIRGTSGNFSGMHVVKSLEFTTNHGRKHGPFGSTDGNAFSMNVNNNSAIVGFHGRCGLVLDALGIFIRPL